MAETKNAPVFSLTDGSVKAAVFENKTEHGVMYSTVLTRLYKDGDDWKETRSFNVSDLANVAFVAARVRMRIAELQDAQEKDTRAA